VHAEEWEQDHDPAESVHVIEKACEEKGPCRRCHRQGGGQEKEESQASEQAMMGLVDLNEDADGSTT
jgi:hypothetical protein